MVGDNIESDVRGAARAGIPAILVHNPPSTEIKYYAENLTDVIVIIENETNG
jgi:ribonucleotide monophosphatase NagD (HAD superfamily)